MGEIARQVPTIQNLESQSDDDLCSVIEQAKAVLEARESERKKQAVAEIRRIAKEHGLDVAVGKTSRRRGRPRNSGTGLA